MVARVNTVAFQGIGVLAVDVQVQMSAGLPADADPYGHMLLPLFGNACRRNPE